MTEYSRVTGVPKAEMTEYVPVPGVPKAEMTEYSRVPGVPTAEYDLSTRESLEYQRLKLLSTRQYL